MTNKSDDDDPRHDRTRDMLSRAAIRLLTLVAIIVLLALAFGRWLGLTPDTVKVLERVFVLNGGLVAIAFGYYFRRRR